MSRLTDNYRHFGPITYARSSWSPLRLVFSTGGGEDDDTPNNVTAHAFGWVARLKLPTRMQPHRVKHMADSWDAATVARLGRNYYFETFPREYGFCISEGHFSLYLGAQTRDSSTTKMWSCFLPWTQWRHVRRSFYDLNGKHWWTEWNRRGLKVFADNWEVTHLLSKACPAAVFEIEDHDGARIQASTRIEEREWLLGEKWCKWLSWFRKPMIRRSLEIEFAAEVGLEKGSWKGGLTGTGIDMLPSELHESAFRRYCEKEHRDKGGRYRIKFIGAVEKPKAEHSQNASATEAK